MTSSLDSLLPAFLQRLEGEESLLRAACEELAAVHEGLRAGDLKAVADSRPKQEATAAALEAAAAARSATGAEIARVLGLTGQAPTLSALADALPERWGAEVRAVRERLAAAAADVDAFRLRNANLIGHLRAYFRGVLSSLTVADAPVRYGPSGKQLSTTAGGAIQARG